MTPKGHGKSLTLMKSWVRVMSLEVFHPAAEPLAFVHGKSPEHLFNSSRSCAGNSREAVGV